MRIVLHSNTIRNKYTTGRTPRRDNTSVCTFYMRQY